MNFHKWLFVKVLRKKKKPLFQHIWNPSKSYLSFGFSPQRLKRGWLYNLEKLREANFLKEIMRNCAFRKKIKLLSCVWLFATPWTVASNSSVHVIFQARVLEWVAISFSRGSSQPRDQTWVSRIVGRCFTIWATREDKLGRKVTIKCHRVNKLLWQEERYRPSNEQKGTSIKILHLWRLLVGYMAEMFSVQFSISFIVFGIRSVSLLLLFSC